MLQGNLSAIKPAAFLLVKAQHNAVEALDSIGKCDLVSWARLVYGPYQIVVYVGDNDEKELAKFIEDLRSQIYVAELDARLCKPLLGDENLQPLIITEPQSAVLLIRVNYRQEQERNLTYHLRKLDGILLARAVWGPEDIIAIVESSDHEAMRNLICDEVKLMKGVESNTTLYCYPEI